VKTTFLQWESIPFFMESENSNSYLLQTLHRIILAEVLLPSISPGEQIKETAAVIYIPSPSCLSCSYNELFRFTDSGGRRYTG